MVDTLLPGEVEGIVGFNFAEVLHEDLQPVLMLSRGVVSLAKLLSPDIEYVPLLLAILYGLV